MKRQASKSQNFLRSPSKVAELVGIAGIKRTDTVYDIGAGSGVISSVLARRAKRVVAIENDPSLVDTLRRNLNNYENVEILQVDAATYKFGGEPYKIFSNIPFHLSSPLLRRLTETKTTPLSIHLIVQKQFAYKLLIEKDGFTNALGATIAPWFATRVRAHLKRTDFWPHPAVDTVMLELLPRDEPMLTAAQRTEYVKFVERCFADIKHFRKILELHPVMAQQTLPSRLKTAHWIELFRKVYGVS